LQELILSYSAVGYSMTQTSFSAFPFWNFFLENLGTISGEHGKSFR
jgi:hypothetical protein